MKVGPGFSYKVGKQDASIPDVLVLSTFLLGLVVPHGSAEKVS